MTTGQGWRELLDPVVERYANSGQRKQFRGEAGFARPEIHECLAEHEFLYAIRVPANAVLERPDNLEPDDPA